MPLYVEEIFPFPCHVAIDPALKFSHRHCPTGRRDACHPSRSSSNTLGSLLAEDVGVTSVEDGHGGASEELSAGSTQLDLSGEVSQMCSPSRENRSLLRWVGGHETDSAAASSVRKVFAAFFSPYLLASLFVYSNSRVQTYVGATVVVDGSLGQHGVVLQLRLAERRCVAGDQDQLGLARAEGYNEIHVSKSEQLLGRQNRIQQTYP